VDGYGRRQAGRRRWADGAKRQNGGGSPEESQRWPLGHHFVPEEHQNKEEDTRTSPGGFDRRKTRRRRRSGRRQSSGLVSSGRRRCGARRSSRERWGRSWGSCSPFIGWRGQAKGATKAVGERAPAAGAINGGGRWSGGFKRGRWQDVGVLVLLRRLVEDREGWEREGRRGEEVSGSHGGRRQPAGGRGCA
jgi:hypothetical protein